MQRADPPSKESCRLCIEARFQRRGVEPLANERKNERKTDRPIIAFLRAYDLSLLVSYNIIHTSRTINTYDL
jgi:hypothetical protein